jgi:hypothetical protein
VRVIVARIGAGYGLRVETRAQVWDAEDDLSRQQLLALAELAGVALHHELGPGWSPTPAAMNMLMPPELNATESDALHAAIAQAIRAGYNRAAQA